jgi:hypothetical protein
MEVTVRLHFIATPLYFNTIDFVVFSTFSYFFVRFCSESNVSDF